MIPQVQTCLSHIESRLILWNLTFPLQDKMNFIHRNEGIHRHGLKLTLGHRDLSMSTSPGPGEDPYEFPWAVVAPATEPKECLWWEKPLIPDSQPPT